MYGLTPQELELSALIIAALNLPMSPQEVDPEAPLYGGTLGLDSIDILEISMVIGKQYGLMISSDNDNKVEIFSCLRSLCTYVQAHKAN
ncbi:phosphopantetheine-binding protein [Acidithiobacillus sp.]|jgi:acyl carrier protein|uniref:phosphopantetheine-binding protein n=1 Tax=Acidithiobacillus sp. TaxID=1872118 RepID=UPI0025B88356|nr:phosphopantetheine-binding protein [Acidithiobacillus sp.]MCK9188866.1 phosphopantetheine-binding protein [Acidithiobacillus sp.]MCK9358349.1 phosphopantetheine-binding protein [Acidithiobacillus sp.]